MQLLRQLVFVVASAILAGAQTPVPTDGQQASPRLMDMDRMRPTYVLGPGDQVVIRATDVEEIGDKPYVLDAEGYVQIPLLGRLRAGGSTVERFQLELIQQLKTYVRNPQVFVNVVHFRSDPVFFVGAFRTPGIYPLNGGRTLIEMITVIGGLQTNARRRVKLTRRSEMGAIPLPTAQSTPGGASTFVEISLGSLNENVNPAEDIALKAFDVISVERAEMVYVGGEVGKVGGFELGERDSVSVVQLVSLAGGVTRSADLKNARILRPISNSSRRAHIPVDLSKVFKGQVNDLPILANDYLYIPSNRQSQMWRNVGLIALPLLPTILYFIR